jgi:glycosyltransferase involved in cell wall biosynthesis
VGLRRILREWRPHILFAHGGGSLLPALIAKGVGEGPVLVYRKIGLTEPWLRKPRRLRLRCHRSLMRRADAIAAVGAAVAVEVLGLLRVPPEKVRVIRQGMDPHALSATPRARERIRMSLGIPPVAPVLLSVGALGWEKHQQAMIRALAAVRGEGRQAVLLLAGAGPERSRLERLAVDLGVATEVRFLGARGDVPDLLAASDLFLLTSLSEGLPGALIEAGMAGVPAVAWDVAGVREVVQDGVTGLVPPFRDERAFTAAVLRLLDDPAAVRRMGAAAGDFCRERFAMDRCVEEHLQFFRELLGGSG